MIRTIKLWTRKFNVNKLKNQCTLDSPFFWLLFWRCVCVFVAFFCPLDSFFSHSLSIGFCIPLPLSQAASVSLYASDFDSNGYIARNTYRHKEVAEQQTKSFFTLLVLFRLLAFFLCFYLFISFINAFDILITWRFLPLFRLVVGKLWCTHVWHSLKVWFAENINKINYKQLAI